MALGPILAARHVVDESADRGDRGRGGEQEPRIVVRAHGVSLRRPRMARALKCRPAPTKSQNMARPAASRGLIVPAAAVIEGAIAPTATAAAAMLFSHVAVSFVRSLWIKLTG